MLLVVVIVVGVLLIVFFLVFFSKTTEQIITKHGINVWLNKINIVCTDGGPNPFPKVDSVIAIIVKIHL